jgi:Tol biopolymer transport system component
MPKISDVLERESRSVDLELGDFERLLDRRERRERNRRIRAGVLGVIVAFAVGTLLVRSLTSDQTPANPPVEPTPAPLSGAIAYDRQGHVYVAGLDGANPVAIDDVVAIDDACSGDVFTALPSWSPDGRHLAFFTECVDATGRDVVIADLQGNVVGAFPAQGYEIGWSPDSTRVAVWDEYRWREGTFTIGIHGIDGGREAQIEMPPGWEPSAQSGGPIWTPDGASLIVSDLQVPLDGGTPRDVPFLRMYMDRSGGWWTGALAYSPDGSQIAYGTPEGLMVARADGSDPREVSGDGAHTAAWSPNGELIAVASATPGAGRLDTPEGIEYEQTPNRLRVVDVATGSTTLLSGGAWFEVIGFSPEGDRVLFGEHRPVVGQPGTWLDSIWSIGVDGSDAHQIVVGTYTGDLRPA